MILGLGVDLVEVSRFESWVGDLAKLQKVFGADEIKIILGAGVGACEKAAARFAAKEAFGKALGTGILGLDLTEIQIVNDSKGKPFYLLTGEALRKIEALEACIQLSLSHERNMAIATAIIDK